MKVFEVRFYIVLFWSSQPSSMSQWSEMWRSGLPGTMLLRSPAVRGQQESVRWHLRPHTCRSPAEHRNTRAAHQSIAGQLGASCSHTGRFPSCTFKYHIQQCVDSLLLVFLKSPVYLLSAQTIRLNGSQPHFMSTWRFLHLNEILVIYRTLSS